MQLGNSLTTTYVYGTVQSRSDARDKAEIRDTILGLDFINAIRPVDYKWDMRDDYFTLENQVNASGETTTTLTPIPRDGSKIRSRFHHGFIAQEIKATCDALNIDFGGYQDHSIKGGNDVLSIGYDELIGPLVKAIQELTARVKELEKS